MKPGGRRENCAGEAKRVYPKATEKKLQEAVHQGERAGHARKEAGANSYSEARAEGESPRGRLRFCKQRVNAEASAPRGRRDRDHRRQREVWRKDKRGAAPFARRGRAPRRARVRGENLRARLHRRRPTPKLCPAPFDGRKTAKKRNLEPADRRRKRRLRLSREVRCAFSCCRANSSSSAESERSTA